MTQRVTAAYAEVLHTDAAAVRVTAAYAEVAHADPAALRVTASWVEVLHSVAEVTADPITGSAANDLGGLVSSAAGTAYQTIAGTAATGLGALLSSAAGTVSAPVPRVRRIALLGSERRAVVLHGTVGRC